MKTSKTYYKDIYNLFPVHSKKEKEYLHKLKQQIEECDTDNYNELEDMIGTPIDVVKSYYDTIPSSYLIKAMVTKKIRIITCLICISLALCVSLWVVYIYQKAYDDFHTSIPVEYVETIEE